MTHFVEFELSDGTTIAIESDDQMHRAAGPVPVSSSHGKIIEKATCTFEEAILKVKPIAESIINQVNRLSKPADEVSVEFGLKLDGSIGSVIAKTGGEANFKIALKWVKEGSVKESK